MRRGADWTGQHVQEYRSWVDSFMVRCHQEGRTVDCADLAIESIIEYSRLHQLHFEITTDMNPRTVKSETDFNSYEEFLRHVKINAGAANLADRPNTRPISPTQIEAGDLLIFNWMQTNQWPNINAHHTLIIIHRNKLWFGNIENNQPTTIDWISSDRLRNNNGPEWYFTHQDLLECKPRRWKFMLEISS